MNPQPHSKHLGYMAVEVGALLNGPDYPDGDRDFVQCPFGTVGDRLWVREAWQAVDADCRVVSGRLEQNQYPNAFYKADGPNPCKWRPSIHMPRWASRITLEITGVRVERLNDISEADAIAEGCQCAGFPASLTNRGAFAKLWQSINGDDSWAANPWVWVVEFRRVEV